MSDFAETTPTAESPRGKLRREHPGPKADRDEAETETRQALHETRAGRADHQQAQRKIHPG